MSSLKRIQQSRNMSQQKLSNLSGITVRTINNLEHDRTIAAFQTRRCLLAALSIPFEQHNFIFGYMQ